MRTTVLMMMMACAPSWDDSTEKADTGDFLTPPSNESGDTGADTDADTDADADADADAWPFPGTYSGTIVMTGATWGDWCEGSMAVTVDEAGGVEGDGSCDWDRPEYGTGTTYFYPSGSVSPDGVVSGDLSIDAVEWGTFTGSLSGTHGESRTNLVMEFDWGGVQDQSVVFERD